MEFDYIRHSIISDIDRKLARIEEKDYCIFRARVQKKHFIEIEREANTHSYKIEHPEVAFKRYNSHVGKSKHRNGLGHLEDTHGWLYGEMSTHRPISEKLIREMAGRIDPKTHKEEDAEYRVLGLNELTGENHLTGVRATGSRYTPPYPDKIPREMTEFVSELNFLLSETSTPATLTAAAYAHLHLARIHPFEDTNGRSARMLQNVMLRLHGLPPPVIYQGERFDYYKVLDTAMVDWRLRTGIKKEYPSKGEINFYEYIAGKVSSSLDRILDL
jgi:Fic family protein